MKRFLGFFLLSLVAIGVIYGGGQQETEAMEKSDEPVELIFSGVCVPGDAHADAMVVFKEELEKISGGSMVVNVFHSGQLYSQEANQAAVIQGTVDMVYSNTSWLAEFVPYLSMFSAVYAFQGYDHMKEVMDGEIGQQVFTDVVDELGIRPLSVFYLGTRQLNLVDKVGPVRTPEDMAGVKLRVPESPAWIALGKALGGNPTPMSFTEVYMGLKTGAVEGQDNPLPTDKNAKFYEVTEYIVLTNHVVANIWPTINEEKWQSLTSQQQEWVLQAIEKARVYCDTTNLETEANILDFFRNEGLVVIEDPDIQAFAEYAKNSYLTESSDISKNWDWDLYEKVQATAK